MAMTGKTKGIRCRCNYASCTSSKRGMANRAKRLTHKKDRQHLKKELHREDLSN